MRLLMAALLVGMTLAGCTDDAPDPLATSDDAGTLAVDLNRSHPTYGFQVSDGLPTGDGSSFYEDTPAGRVWLNPPHKPLPDDLSALAAVAHVEGITAAHGIAVFGSLAFAGPQGSGPLSVIDIRDPTKPTVIGVATDIPVRDADVIAYPDGRLVVISTSGGRAITATDVTDPTAPQLIGTVDTPGSNHNIAVVPGTPIVYNSGMDIVDFSDPEAPVVTGAWGGDGCHDTAFFMDRSRDMFRAYCAGYAFTEIWDISSPLFPQLIIEIPFPGALESMPGPVGAAAHEAGLSNTVLSPGFSHLAMVNHDASILIVGDETGGGAINACDFYVDAGEQGTMSGPIGNLYFYDITDETAPDLKGHVSPSYPDAVGVPSPDQNDPLPDACTAHFGQIIEDTGFLVMAFYGAGIVLVDFRDPDNPAIVDMLDQGGELWDVWYHAGRLYTGDMERGVDVIELA